MPSKSSATKKSSKPNACTQKNPLYPQFCEAVKACLLNPTRKTKGVGYKFFAALYPELTSKFDKGSLEGQLSRSWKKLQKELEDNGYYFDGSGRPGKKKEEETEPREYIEYALFFYVSLNSNES